MLAGPATRRQEKAPVAGGYQPGRRTRNRSLDLRVDGPSNIRGDIEYSVGPPEHRPHDVRASCNVLSSTTVDLTQMSIGIAGTTHVEKLKQRNVISNRVFLLSAVLLHFPFRLCSYTRYSTCQAWPSFACSFQRSLFCLSPLMIGFC